MWPKSQLDPFRHTHTHTHTHIKLLGKTKCYHARSFYRHPIDIIWSLVLVWRIRRKIIRTALCCIMYESCAQWYAHMRAALTFLHYMLMRFRFLFECLFRFCLWCVLCVSLGHFVLVLLAFVMVGLISSVLSKQIGWEERLRDDLFCVEWDVKPSLNEQQGLNIQPNCSTREIFTQLARQYATHHGMMSHNNNTHHQRFDLMRMLLSVIHQQISVSFSNHSTGWAGLLRHKWTSAHK